MSQLRKEKIQGQENVINNTRMWKYKKLNNKVLNQHLFDYFSALKIKK